MSDESAPQERTTIPEGDSTHIACGDNVISVSNEQSTLVIEVLTGEALIGGGSNTTIS